MVQGQIPIGVTTANLVAPGQTVLRQQGVQRNFRYAEARPLGTWALLIPQKNASLHLLPCQIRSSRSNRTSEIMEICQKILTPHAPPFKVTQSHWNRHGSIGQLCRKFEEAGLRPQDGAYMARQKHAPPPATCVTVPNLVALSNYGDRPQKFNPSPPALQGHSKSLEPTWIDRLTAIYDFLLVFHSNYGPISYPFRVKGQYLPNFITPGPRTFM